MSNSSDSTVHPNLDLATHRYRSTSTSLFKMDPWSNRRSAVTTSEDILTKFEDNFVPEISDKLPDHEQYLAILESKLRKLKSDPNVLRQLAAKKEACMQQLLSEESERSVVQLSLEEPVADSPILRTILPQKQALNQGEIVEFIKYDQLIEDEGSDSQVNGKPEDKVEGQAENQKSQNLVFF